MGGRNRLETLIDSLKPDELRRAAEFLQLPEVNRRADIRQLFQLLKKQQHRKFPQTDETLFRKIYPERPYHSADFRLLRTYLTRALEEYLIYRELSNDQNLRDRLLLTALRRRKLYRHLDSTLKKQDKRPTLPGLDPVESSLAGFYRERERATLIARTDRTADLNLQRVENALDRAVWAYKLRQACFSRSHERIVSTRYELSLIGEILQASARETDPAVAVYRSCYIALFHEPSEANFTSFRDLLAHHTALFPHEELRALYLLALNYCIRRINENRLPYLREAFTIYADGIASKALLENGRISRFTFFNAAGIALRLGELDWTEQLLRDHATALPETGRRATVALTRARLSFARGHYDKAFTHLLDSDTFDLFDTMAARILQLKIYYETDAPEAFEHFLSATRRFVDRHRESYHYELWRQILHFLRKLHELNPHDPVARTTLRGEVEAAENLMEREWLLGCLG